MAPHAMRVQIEHRDLRTTPVYSCGGFGLSNVHRLPSPRMREGEKERERNGKIATQSPVK